jgi:hypothetical protein
MTEMSDNTPNNLLQIFALGGAGTTIGSTFEHYRGEAEPGMAPIDICYVDTSRSNLKGKNIPEDKIFIVPGLEQKDGSGKRRSQNAKLIMKHRHEILQQFQPGYVNVLISSASGGTGAVAAAILSKELLAQGKMVINITIGVADSGTEIENTLEHLQSFEGLSNALKKTVPVAYFENTKATPMSKVDELITELVVALAVMFSRLNEGMDTQDMHHFLNIEVLTRYAPHVVGLQTFIGDLVESEHKDTISVASVVTNKDNRGIDFVLPYTTYGILPAEIGTEISDKAPVHLVTKAYPFNGITDRLKKMLDDMEKAAKASTATSTILSGDEELEDGFLKMSR